MFGTPPPHTHTPPSVHVSNAFLRWNQGWSARFPAKITGIPDSLRVLGSEGSSSQFATERFDHFQEPNPSLSAVLFRRVRLMWCQGRKGASQSIICRYCNKAVTNSVSLFFLKQTFSDSCAFWLSVLWPWECSLFSPRLQLLHRQKLPLKSLYDNFFSQISIASFTVVFFNFL